MKKNQLLTVLMLLGSVHAMFASTAALSKYSVPVTNRSNAYAKVVINYNDKNNNSDNTGVMAPGEESSITVEKGKIIKNVMVYYYTGKKGNTKLDKANMTILAPAAWPTSLDVYGDGNTEAGALVGEAPLESKANFEATTLTAEEYPSRFLAYWKSPATAASETAGSLQPVSMYTLSTDGKLTTVKF